MRCPQCRVHFSLLFLTPQTPELRCIRLIFSSGHLRLECKIKLLRTVAKILQRQDVALILQVMELLILLSSPPDRQTLCQLKANLGLKPDHTHLWFAWKHTRQQVRCSIK